jgi:sec-independent protein translocase protein TatC
MAKSKNATGQMSLGGHLKELRTRVFWIALFIVCGSVGGWFLFEPVFNALQAPILQAASDSHINATVNFNTIGGAFDLRLQVSAFVGAVISSPLWLYQLWAFIVPALKRRERLYTLAFLGTSIPLFLGGCYLAWASIPNFVRALLSMTPAGSTNLINANEYILFAVRVLLLFGLAFVLPVVLVMLNFMGLLSAAAILKGWRLAVVISAFVAALATPVADPTSMFVLMIPLLVLYFAALGIAALRDRTVARRQRKMLAEYGIQDSTGETN